jgi:hypothetical protein
MVRALNTISGQISDVPPKILLHPKFKDILEVVDEDRKPYAPVLYQSGTKAEKAEKRKTFWSEQVEDENSIEDDE